LDIRKINIKNVIINIATLLWISHPRVFFFSDQLYSGESAPRNYSGELLWGGKRTCSGEANVALGRESCSGEANVALGRESCSGEVNVALGRNALERNTK